jgi:F-type H+-transporting ATPase subunit epsilon
MKLKVLGPARVLLEEEVTRVLAHGREGYFCLLPRHVDYVTVLEAGPLTYDDSQGHTREFEIGESVLVKCGPDILISPGAGGSASNKEPMAEKEGNADTERQRQARRVMADMEAEFTGRCLRERKEG